VERSGSDRRSSGGAKPGGGSARGSGGRPGGRSGGKPSGRPGDKSGSKPGGKPSGRPGGKPGSKPGGKSDGKPGGRSSDRDQRGPAKRSSGGRPGGQSGGKPGGQRSSHGGAPRGGRPGPRRTSDERPQRPPRPVGPAIPDEVDITELDPAVLNELRTLPEDLGEKVAGHLAAAELLLLEDDDEGAREHAKAAKKLAGRVAAVREAAGVTAYRCADYADALAELRAVRRMTGDDSFVPMMADCERGLGRPERALELLRDIRDGDPALKVESQIVAAGARSDMEQHEAALVLLDIPELTALPQGSERARLQYAYASVLEALGRQGEAREWFTRAVESDVDGVTDAAERLN